MRWLLFGTLLLWGCGGGAVPRGATTTAAVATSAPSNLRSGGPGPQEEPEACSAEAVRKLAEDFLAAYTRGESDLTERFFAPTGEFQWYSEPPARLNRDAFDRQSLDAYLARRHSEGDQLALNRFDFNGYRAEDGTAHFGFLVRRHGTTLLDGKGAVSCASRAFIVWSLGPNPGPTGT